MVEYLAGNRIRGLSSEKESIAVSLTDLNAYYKFDESAGNLLNKASAVGSTDAITADGVNTGVTYLQSGIIDNSYLYDGTNDFTTVDPLHTSTSNTGSIFFFWNATTFTSGAVPFGLGDTSANEFIFMELSGTDKINVFCRLAGTTKWVVNCGSYSNPQGTWHSFGITHNGTTSILYRDGVANTNFTTSTDTSIWVNDLPSLDNCRIGCINRNGTGNGDFFNGNVDELSYWSRALTASEISTLHNSGNGKAISSPIDVTDGSIFYETDTNKSYVLSGTTWSEL